MFLDIVFEASSPPPFYFLLYSFPPTHASSVAAENENNNTIASLLFLLLLHSLRVMQRGQKVAAAFTSPSNAQGLFLCHPLQNVQRLLQSRGPNPRGCFLQRHGPKNVLKAGTEPVINDNQIPFGARAAFAFAFTLGPFVKIGKKRAHRDLLLDHAPSLLPLSKTITKTPSSKK